MNVSHVIIVPPLARPSRRAILGWVVTGDGVGTGNAQQVKPLPPPGGVRFLSIIGAAYNRRFQSGDAARQRRRHGDGHGGSPHGENGGEKLAAAPPAAAVAAECIIIRVTYGRTICCLILREN
ncbi:hypothetical protein niasHT_014327 [Heterodera trifolii]|uniref:Uncharacterized protein n=1 Tax=Heterodera trifolii TaxID=157864 RepID=A0ABD2L7Z3_9BILA